MRNLSKLNLLAIPIMLLGYYAANFNQALAQSIVRTQVKDSQIRPSIGINLSMIKDYSSQIPFNDVFKTSRPWISGNNGEQQTIMLNTKDGHYPAGIYTVTYDGNGSILMSRDAVHVLSQRPGKIEVQIEPTGKGIGLAISASDPNNPIRNIHVWLPGSERAASEFNPQFLNLLRPFSTLRFMDWEMTNNSPVQSWQDRATPQDERYTNKNGVPIEVMIDLANVTGKDAWFTIPHQADDNYVLNFAQLVKQRLNPRLKVYIEYSNEVWNHGFQQTRYAVAMGNQMNLGSDENQASLRFYSQRAVQIFQIWSSVFGSDPRLVRVVCVQAGNTWASEQVLGWQNAYRSVDALGIAPYFGFQFGSAKNVEQTLTMQPDQLLGALQQELNAKNLQIIIGQAQVAKKYHIPLVAYEGGQHLVGVGKFNNDPNLQNLFFSANRSPAMGQLYTTYLNNWFSNGGTLINLYASCGQPNKWGSWGLVEYMDGPFDAWPKYRAILQFEHQ